MTSNTTNITFPEKYIFGNIFLMANRVQAIGDRGLGSDGMTIKQWFLTIIVLHFDNYSPTLGEAAKIMGSSHQNVKQLALKLQQKGFLKIEKDQQDFRNIRLSITQKVHLFWKKQELEIKEFLTELLIDLSKDEIDELCNFLKKLQTRMLDLQTTYNCNEMAKNIERC